MSHHGKDVLPEDIIIKILMFMPPKQCYLACVYLRFTHLYRHCIPRCSKLKVEIASKHGHVAVLNWWKQSGLPVKYSENAMDYASWHGHVAVLDWWKQSGLRSTASVRLT